HHGEPTMTTPRTPYASPIRARWRDRSTGLGFEFLEAPFNKAVAELATDHSEHLRRALVLALFPQLAESDWPGGRTPHLEESGNGADFVAVDHYPKGQRTELAHPPRSGANRTGRATGQRPGQQPDWWRRQLSSPEASRCRARLVILLLTGGTEALQQF